MSLPADLLQQARFLAVKEPRRPLQANLRRAVSSAYYAVFHLLVDAATSRMLRGSERAGLRSCVARAFGHGTMRQVAQQFSANRVSSKLSPGLNGQPLQKEVIYIAATFVELQQARHEADYDTMRSFTRREVIDLVEQVERAVLAWSVVRASVQADTFLAGLLAFGNLRN